MVKANLAVFHLTWSKALGRNRLEMWDIVDEREELIKIHEFGYNVDSFCLGCFEIYFSDRPVGSFDEFIDKVIIKYEKCKLTIELYKKNKLIDMYDTNDRIIIRKGNILLDAFIF